MEYYYPHSLSIPRVKSQHMVELHIIDFILSSCLEPLVDEEVFSVSYPQLLVVEDTSEPGVADKSTLGLVFVLEEWFNQQTTVFHICANSQQNGVELTLLGGGKLVAGVEDGGHFEVGERFGGVLL